MRCIPRNRMRHQWNRRIASFILTVAIISMLLPPASILPARPVWAATPSVSIVAPDDGAVLFGVVTLQANVNDTTASSVQFFYDPHEDTDPEIALGFATFNATTGLWSLSWDTRTLPDTYNIIDTNGDGVEDTTVNLTKPPTSDRLRVAAVTGAGTLGDEIDVRIQNMLTARIFLPDNTDDVRGFQDLEALVTGEYAITSVRFDVYDIANADPAILTPFGEFDSLGEPIENRQYGRPLGNPVYPTGSPAYPIGVATFEGSRRWVFRGWDTTTVPDGSYLVVATAEDTAGRRATYSIVTYIVNDLRVAITAPDDGATVSRFVALEARTSSLTGADNAAPGSLWPATAVNFTIGSTTIPATETPAGSGRWRAVWNGDAFAPGPYTITATATNNNPNGAETAVDSINVNLVAPGLNLAAFFPFDWSNCTLFECAFLDGSGGGPNWWLWEFGDGNTSTAQLPTHTYANYGIYTVRLTVSNDGGVTTDTYERVIPVGNTGVVSFNRNAIDDGETQFIDWTSAFKNFTYTVGDTLAIPVMWKSTTGATQFVSLPSVVCDADEDTPNQECVIFTPEEADGIPPTLIGAAQDGVLFTMAFTEVQYRGATDIFKGKANLRIQVQVDSDGDGSLDATVQLGTNVDVTNSGSSTDESTVVKVTAPAEGQFVGGNSVPVKASVVSSVTADQVEFFVNAMSIGVDANSADGWSVNWNTLSFADGPYQITAVARFGALEAISDVRNVTVNNAIPAEPPPPAGTFQIGRVSDTTGTFISFAHEVEEEEAGGGGPGGGGKPNKQPTIGASMTAEIVPSSIVVYTGGTPNSGVIGGDALEFDIVLTNTSTDPGAILTAYAFQSKVSESPALGSRVGDKAFYGLLVSGGEEGKMTSVKKNGTSNGLFSGKWKGICINSSLDFIPEFNSGLEDESLECGGNRVDTDEDGEPELLTGDDILGLRPGESQTVRIRIEAGTTDGALHVVEAGTLTGSVKGVEKVGPNGVTYFDVEMDVPGTVLDVIEWGDNKVLRQADGTFDPTFAPLADGLSFAGQQYLTLPRRNFAFSDILGRNHTCETYGLHLLAGTPCFGNPNAQPTFNFLGVGDLVPGVQNFAAILQGFGEFYDPNNDFVPDINPDSGDTRPSFPYGVLCRNCGGQPYVPIAEFYKDNGDGTVTQQMVAGSYGALGSATQYKAVIDAATADEWKEEVIPEPDPGGPPTGPQLSTSASGQFHSLATAPGAGINGGDAIEFTIDIINTSLNPNAYVTAFNYQTKRRGLADIGILDGFTQDRRDVRVAGAYDEITNPTGLPLCTSLDDGACWNESLGVGHFPNVIGNGLLFGQMVWTDADAGREPFPVDADQVHVAASGIDPTPYWLESVKKNGPFAPILKGNTNFICVKSGLFDLDPDSDAACAGEPAILFDPNGKLIPSNISQRLGLPPGETQSVRIRMEFGDFRGALLEIVDGLLTTANVRADYAATDGLARFFDCSDQRELEWCHPHLVGENIGYLPNTNATWLTPQTLEDIKYVIINQPGDAPTVMNFQENFGYILAMAGFIPSAEFYAPDPNPDLVGTPDAGILIRQQVLGEYAMTDVPPIAPLILSTPVTQVAQGQNYLYNVAASAYPGPVNYSLDTAPSGMGINSSTGQITWTPNAGGLYNVTVRASNGTAPDATQSFQVAVSAPILDNFNRSNGLLGNRWAGLGYLLGYRIANQQVDVNLGGPIFWKNAFGAAQEAAITLNKIDSKGQHGLLLKAEKNLLTTSAILVSYWASNQTIVVESKVPRKWSKIVGTYKMKLNDGDRLGARALANGKVEVYVNNALIGTYDAGSYFANRKGHIGLWHLFANNAWLDDFNGGNIANDSLMAANAEETDLYLIDDFDGFEASFFADVEEDEALMQGKLFLPFVNGSAGVNVDVNVEEDEALMQNNLFLPMIGSD